MTSNNKTAFFTEVTLFKRILYTICILYVLCTAIAVILEPFLTLTCDEANGTTTSSSSSLTTKLTSFPNPLYVHDPCLYKLRYLQLMGLTRRECIFGRHMVMSVLLGSIIGYERRTADRPAGIRTMSVVSLTACLFTLNSTFVFIIGPMSWDPARVSASVPSGVGFLGAGLMIQDIHKESGITTLTVKGLNTAASVWLSAAVGVACGGGLYFCATFTTALMLILLRFGPRASLVDRADSVLGMSLPYRSNAP